jgi:hypothetical protein
MTTDAIDREQFDTLVAKVERLDNDVADMRPVIVGIDKKRVEGLTNIHDQIRYVTYHVHNLYRRLGFWDSDAPTPPAAPEPDDLDVRGGLMPHATYPITITFDAPEPDDAPDDRAVIVTVDTHAAIGEALHRHLELPNMDTDAYDRMIADIAEAALRAAVRGEDDK